MMFFAVPVLRLEPAASDWDHCLATYRVAQVQQQGVADGANSIWAVAVTVQARKAWWLRCGSRLRLRLRMQRPGLPLGPFST